MTIKSYDKENKIPILKCSICTNEKIAGFKDIHTNEFEEVMLISNKKDLDYFVKMYDLDSSRIKREY